jgi:hypothetical protein
MYDEDALPSEARVKRFLRSLSQCRKAQRDQDTAVIVAEAALRSSM